MMMQLDRDWGRGSSALLLALAACAPARATPPATPVAAAAHASAPNAPAPVWASGAKHVQSRGDAPLARFGDPERGTKLRAAIGAERAGLEQELRALGAPGFALGVVVDGELVLAAGEGTTVAGGGAPVTPATVFRIGSITKVFTALALLMLRDEGRLDLDAPLRRWLPELDAVVYPTADSPLVTPRHVLLHRSGLPRLGDFDYTVPGHPPSEAEVLGALEGVELQGVPGLAEEYSNFGYGLLGVLASRIAGQPFEDFVSQRVFGALGMLHSAWAATTVPPEQLARPHAIGKSGVLEVVPEWEFGASAGAGGIYASVEDLARFVAWELDAWPASSRADGAPLSRTSRRESQSLQAVDDLLVREENEQATARVDGTGVGWGAYRDCRFELVSWHNGGTEGHGAAIYLLPERGIGLILLANRDGVNLDAPARRWLARLHDAGVLPARELSAEPSERWRQHVDAALGAGASLDPARYEALFGAHFREVISSEAMASLLAGQQQAAGHCRTGAALAPAREHWSATSLECERGEPSVVEAVLDRHGRFAGFWIGTRARYEERRRERGTERSSCRRP
jgi:CubicO group peptidase (beta-lactamase class C family)